jgi:hypothetical protein
MMKVRLSARIAESSSGTEDEVFVTGGTLQRNRRPPALRSVAAVADERWIT